MYIESSISIKENYLCKIEEAAQKLHISRSRLITLLIMRYIEKNMASKRFLKRLKYQCRDDAASWHITGICLRKDIYEKCWDIRKAYKMSLSFVIAEAIVRYIDEIVDEILNAQETYNYEVNYIWGSKYYVDIYATWSVWGVPDPGNLTKILNL